MPLAHAATYSPEDNKIRLYFSNRIPRDEWDALKSIGFSWTMKQDSDMSATWTPAREDAALDLCGEIGDEDQPRAERSADRAERFSDYGDKREDEANASLTAANAAGTIHANQDATRAEASARKADRLADRSVNLWATAEYWTRRTAGVIAHALRAERADVRHRRIKELFADLRRLQADYIPSKTMEGADQVGKYMGIASVEKGHDVVGIFGQGRGSYFRSWCKASPLAVGPSSERWMQHLTLRLEYERQMLAAQGGTAADTVTMEVSGLVMSRGREYMITKLSRDRNGLVSRVWLQHPVDKRVVSIEAENITPGSYRAPTNEERHAFNGYKAATPSMPPLINPDQDTVVGLLERINANQEAEQRKYSTEPYIATIAMEMTSDEWQKRLASSDSWHVREVFGVRIRSAGGYRVVRVIVVLTDKPRKGIPVSAQQAVNVPQI